MRKLATGENKPTKRSKGRQKASKRPSKPTISAATSQPSKRPGSGRVVTVEPAPYKPGCTATTIEEVPLEDITLEDTTFQYRLDARLEDLKRSLTQDGQQEPLALQAGSTPYRIIDGFRRLAALKAFGWPSAKAVIHQVDDEEAHRMAFVKNVVRKNLSPTERALAVDQAIKRGRKVEELARELSLSERQIFRYRNLAQLPEPVQELVDQQRLSMAHALAMTQATPDNPADWAARCEQESWTTKQLRRELRKELGSHAGGRRRTFIRQEKDTIRFFSRSISKSAPAEERQRAVTALKEAIAFLEE